LKGIFVLIALGALLLIPTTNFAFAQVSDFYWNSDTPTGDEVFTADAATKTVSQVTGGGFSRINDVEYDQTASKVWWNNWTPGTPSATEGIYSSNVDGSGQVQVLSGLQNSCAPGTSNPAGLHGIVLDPANSDVYFTRGVSYANCGGGEVSVIGMNGAGYTILDGTPGGDSWFPSGIELDSATSTLYWGNPGLITGFAGDGSINSMTTAGAGHVYNIVPHTTGEGRSLALDAANGLIFYSSHDSLSPGTGGAIWVYDIGLGAATLEISDPGTGIPDVELDTANMIIYWTDYARDEIRSASYDASGSIGPHTVEISGVLNPYGLALAFEDVVVGGESLSLDSRALLLAGMSANLSIIVPIVAGIAGVGAYYIRSKMNKA
jgi:hypothetical protein